MIASEERVHITGSSSRILFVHELKNYQEIASAAYYLIPAGGMYSYSPSFFDKSAITVRTNLMSKILELDPVNKTVRVESGVTFGELTNFLWANGYDFPVVPGYPGITIGGGVAANCHGKNPYKDGSIVSWINSFRLLGSDGKTINITQESSEELFDLTVGGFGLTGVITDVTLIIRPAIIGNYLQTTIKTKLTSAFLDNLKANSFASEICYGWIDLTQNFRGVVFSAKKIDKKSNFRMPTFRRLPSSFIGINLWGLGLSVFVNNLFYIIAPRERVVPNLKAVFPLMFNRWIFGCFSRGGLEEFQVIINEDLFDEYIKLLFRLKEKYKIQIPLASCRMFSGERKLLRFSDFGVSVGVTVAGKNKALFVSEIENYCASKNVLINLSKKSNFSNNCYEKIYPEINKFRLLRHKFGFDKKYISTLSRELNI